MNELSRPNSSSLVALHSCHDFRDPRLSLRGPSFRGQRPQSRHPRRTQRGRRPGGPSCPGGGASSGGWPGAWRRAVGGRHLRGGSEERYTSPRAVGGYLRPGPEAATPGGRGGHRGAVRRDPARGASEGSCGAPGRGAGRSRGGARTRISLDLGHPRPRRGPDTPRGFWWVKRGSRCLSQPSPPSVSSLEFSLQVAAAGKPVPRRKASAPGRSSPEGGGICCGPQRLQGLTQPAGRGLERAGGPLRARAVVGAFGRQGR